MRIVSITAQTLRWPIASDGAARGRTERAAVVIEVRTSGGRGSPREDVIGLGEAAPLLGLSRDTLEDAERAIAACARLVPFELADHDAAVAVSAVATVSPAARFAIETALLDALARDAGVSLSTLVARAGGEMRATRVPVAAVVDDPAAAQRAFAAGVRCFKIKLAADDDPGRVFAIAAAVPGARLRIDANRSWPRAEVADRLAALAGLPIDYVEEPCVDAHLMLAEPLSCKLALDESLGALGADELREALRSPQLAAVVLKPTLLGGLSAARALAEQARAANVAAIASHGLEGPIGTAACAELALALGGEHPVGLAAHAALAGWSIEVPQLAADHVHPATAAGLGFAGLDLSGALRACRTAAPTGVR